MIPKKLIILLFFFDIKFLERLGKILMRYSKSIVFITNFCGTCVSELRHVIDITSTVAGVFSETCYQRHGGFHSLMKCLSITLGKSSKNSVLSEINDEDTSGAFASVSISISRL